MAPYIFIIIRIYGLKMTTTALRFTIRILVKSHGKYRLARLTASENR